MRQAWTSVSFWYGRKQEAHLLARHQHKPSRPAFPSVQGQAGDCGGLCLQPLHLLQHAAPRHHQERYVPGGRREGVGPYWGGALGGNSRPVIAHWASSPPGTDIAAMPLTMKKFVAHATCHDSLELQEQETYLIMGHTSDLWRIKSECVWASCPGDSGPGPLPYHSPVPGTKISTASVSRSLGFESCTEWRCRLCTAQL